jgi:hypothetical protein
MNHWIVFFLSFLIFSNSQLTEKEIREGICEYQSTGKTINCYVKEQKELKNQKIETKRICKEKQENCEVKKICCDIGEIHKTKMKGNCVVIKYTEEKCQKTWSPIEKHESLENGIYFE